MKNERRKKKKTKKNLTKKVILKKGMSATMKTIIVCCCLFISNLHHIKMGFVLSSFLPLLLVRCSFNIKKTPLAQRLHHAIADDITLSSTSSIGFRLHESIFGQYTIHTKAATNTNKCTLFLALNESMHWVGQHNRIKVFVFPFF